MAIKTAKKILCNSQLSLGSQAPVTLKMMAFVASLKTFMMILIGFEQQAAQTARLQVPPTTIHMVLHQVR